MIQQTQLQLHLLFVALYECYALTSLPFFGIRIYDSINLKNFYRHSFDYSTSFANGLTLTRRVLIESAGVVLCVEESGRGRTRVISG